MEAPQTTAPPQSEPVAGDFDTAVTLSPGSAVDIAANTEASLFGGIVAPGTASIVLEAGAVIFLPAITPSNVTLVLSSGSELILAAETLPEFAGNLAALPLGALIDITGCQITSVTTTDMAVGQYGLVLSDARGVVGTIDISSAPSTLLIAIPDGLDGSLILSGSAPPSITVAAAESAVSAETFTWRAGNTGRWVDVADWQSSIVNGERVPGSTDTVIVSGLGPGLTSLAGAGNYATLDVSGMVALSGPYSGTMLSIGDAAGDALILTPNTTMTVNSASVIDGIFSIQTSRLSVTGTLAIARTMDVVSASTIVVGALRLDGGTLRLSNDSAMLIGTDQNQTTGTVEISSNAALTGTGTVDASLELDGLLEVPTGTLSIFGGIFGFGIVQLDAGGTLFSSDGLGSSTIAFATGSGATLETFGVLSGALLTGFHPGDVLEIAGIPTGTLSWAPAANGGTLDLGIYGAIAIDLAPALDPQKVSFAEVGDGVGGVAITVLPCFTAETRLRTPTGWINAGAVAPQTWLCNARGAARRAVWVGHTVIERWRRADRSYLDPVRLSPNAIGMGLPLDYLRLSPLHGVVVDTAAGVRVVPAVALCDGKHITRERGDDRIDYVHIALEHHDTILAEGLPCESFLPHGPDPRSQFTRSSGQMPRRTPALAARLEHGPMLDDLRLRLGLEIVCSDSAPQRGAVDAFRTSGRNLSVEGWAAARTAVEFLVDHQPTWRGRCDTWRADLEAAHANEGRAAFVATIPHPRLLSRLSLRMLN